MTILLTVTQVGLGKDEQKDNELFKRVNKWFTNVLIAILFTLVVLFALLSVFYFLDNSIATKQEEDQRLGVEEAQNQHDTYL